MLTWDGSLPLVAVVFALVNGANDGGAMVATTLRAPGLPPWSALALLAAAIGLAPFAVGTRVAETLTAGLVSAPPAARPTVLGAGVTAAMAVVVALQRQGLPTSLTLATVGGITGGGLGAGLAVSWPTVGGVLAVAALAPVVGVALGYALMRVPVWLWANRQADRGLAATHVTAFGLQSLAYAANDGQKMFAVVAVASAPSGPGRTALLAVPLLFVAGALLTLRRVAGVLGGELMPARPAEEVAAELAAATAVSASAAVGAPVSMTQAVSGGLIGAGLVRGVRRVRWLAAGRLTTAWLLTLPSSVAVGALLVALPRWWP